MGTRGGGYEAILDQVGRCEELGFDTVVLAERHFHHAPLLYPSPLPVAGAIAARTQRMRIGTAGRILSLDHPIHVAEAAATVDVLSDGRLDFGVTRASLDEEAHVAFHRRTRSLAAASWRRSRSSCEPGPRTRSASRASTSACPRCRSSLSRCNGRTRLYVVAVSPERLAFAAREGINAYIGAIRTPEAVGEAARSYRHGLAAAATTRARRRCR